MQKTKYLAILSEYLHLTILTAFAHILAFKAQSEGKQTNKKRHPGRASPIRGILSFSSSSWKINMDETHTFVSPPHTVKCPGQAPWESSPFPLSPDRFPSHRYPS